MRLFWHQLKAEQLTFWRSREAAIFLFLFPPLLFVLLGVGLRRRDRRRRPAASSVAGLIGYAVANTALGGLAITLVVRREYGILKRLRSTPLPARLYLAAVVLSSMLIVALQSATVVALGVLLYDAKLPTEPLSFGARASAVGAVAFAGLGLAAAALIRRRRRSRPSST